MMTRGHILESRKTPNTPRVTEVVSLHHSSQHYYYTVHGY